MKRKTISKTVVVKELCRICDRCGAMLHEAFDTFLNRIWVCRSCMMIVEPKPIGDVVAI